MSDVKEFFDNIAADWDSTRDNKARERIKSLVNTLPIHEGDKVLDVACGTGEISHLLFQMSKNKVIAIDISEKMILKAKEKYQGNDIEFIQGDFLSYQFNNKFDSIVIFDAYPHFLDINGLKEAFDKNLNKDGYAIIFHDISRRELDECHSGQRVMKVSRKINPPEEEYESYKDLFDLIRSEDNNDSYFLIMKKKSA